MIASVILIIKFYKNYQSKYVFEMGLNLKNHLEHL